MYPYRVFVSYCRQDREAARLVRAHLEQIGARPMSDVDIPPGVPFTEEIQDRISRAHVVIPLLTEASRGRPWVHQEIGYALGQGVPIMPLALSSIPEGMAEKLEAIRVGQAGDPGGLPDRDELARKLRTRTLERAVNRSRQAGIAAFQCAELRYQRTRLLVDYARNVLQEEGPARIRQRISFSSFSLPDRRVSHPSWDLRDGPSTNPTYVRKLLRAERQVMEQHAVRAGCDLILDPYVSTPKHGTEGALVRLKVLADFLDAMPDDSVRVVFDRGNIEGSLILVGDYFAAEAVMALHGRVYKQTMFTHHAPTVLSHVEDFDRLMDDLLEEEGLAPEASRARALGRLGELVEDYGGRRASESG